MRQVRIAFIGSRETPLHVCTQVTQLCCALATPPERRHLIPCSHIRHIPHTIEFVGLSGGAAGFDELNDCFEDWALEYNLFPSGKIVAKMSYTMEYYSLAELLEEMED